MLIIFGNTDIFSSYIVNFQRGNTALSTVFYTGISIGKNLLYFLLELQIDFKSNILLPGAI